MARLTHRQAQIVRLLIQGKNQEDVARELSISPGAVRAHMTKARDRIEVRSTAELVYKAHDELVDSGSE